MIARPWILLVCMFYLAVIGVALGQTSPPAIIEPVVYSDDPAPGIPGFTLSSVTLPKIDGEGNIFFFGFLGGPDSGPGNCRAIFCGPPGDVQKVLWESEQAPDMPDGVIISDLLTAGEEISEVDGWIEFTLTMTGPGIETDVNDRAVFVGPPGDFQMVIQGGDQAPGCEAGTTIACASAVGFGGIFSDNGTLRVVADLVGPSVTSWNDRACWMGTRDHLELVFREGMQAPGCDPGVVFATADYTAHNDAGQFSFRGCVTGPGVTSTNRTGHWLGGPGSLVKVARRGDPVPGMTGGETWLVVGNDTDVVNAFGDVAEAGIIQGPGVTEDDDCVLFVGNGDQIYLVSREGDLAPEAGPDVHIETISMPRVNNRSEILYRVMYDGPGITDSNKFALYFGPFGAGELTLRDGDPAPTFPEDVSLCRVVAASSLAAMNDVGDIVTVTQIAGPGVTDDDKVVLWFRHHVLQRWVPLLRSGMTIGGRTVYAADEYDFGDAYCDSTGGGDGKDQSFNDLGMLAVNLEFTDGTEGIFRISPPVFGDANCDGVLDGRDIAPFIQAMVDRDAYEGQYPDCDADAYCDLNADEEINGEDIDLFVQLLLN